MYEEYLHGLTSSLSSGQTLVKHVPPSSSTPCLPVNGHPSDCQGISQVVQLTLTYSLCVVWGSISCPLVSVTVEMQGLVWNTVIACMAVGCLILSLIFDSEEITEWPASMLFPGCSLPLSTELRQQLTGNNCDFPVFLFPTHIFFRTRMMAWLKWKQVFQRQAENICFLDINQTATEVQVYSVIFTSHLDWSAGNRKLLPFSILMGDV